VTGVEIQGLVVDVLYTNTALERVIMPSSSLQYGHCDDASKTAALLWCLWLFLFGPEESDVRKACDMVRCITTVFGVEMRTIECLDLLKAFMDRIVGAPVEMCMGPRGPHERFAPERCQVGGWSHALGGIMKEVANPLVEWPEIPSSARRLCFCLCI
jgi:hypothetical protein